MSETTALLDTLWRHDLVPQYERFRGELAEAAARVFASGRYILGEELRRFEEEFAAYTGCAHGVGVASGTDALALALRAAGLEPGDEVLVPVYGPTPTPAAVLQAGGAPVFVDVEPRTGLLDPALLEAAVTRRCRFVLPVHLFGLPCDMPALLEIAGRRGLTVIEDAAQAHGSSIADGGDRRAGSWAPLSCFSFYPTKNLGAYGDGGMVLTGDAGLAGKLRLLRNYGKREDPFDSWVPGVNSRLDELQAAFLRVKLRHLETLNAERAERVRLYREGLAGTPVTFLDEPAGRRTNHHVLTVLCARRDELQAFLAARRIQTNVYYPRPLHRMPAYRRHAGEGRFPVAEALSREALALPLYSELPLADVGRVVEAVRDFHAPERGRR